MSLLPENPDDWQIDRHFIEEVTDEAHDYRAMVVNLRGLSESQKEIVIQCERRRSCAPKRVIEELNRLASSAIGRNEPDALTTTPFRAPFFLLDRKLLIMSP